MNIKNYIQQHPQIKKAVYRFLMHPIKTRPNWWIRPFVCLFMHRGKGSVIYRSVRKDITPFHPFVMGKRSVIEDYACINNTVGELRIGDESRIGIHNTIIGPVHIGNQVNLAQGVVVSGLNHNFADTETPISEQGVSSALITINDDVWIGANSIIAAGVTIGRHCVIGAGSVVAKDIPDYSVAVGSPAKVIKRIEQTTN